MNAKTRPEPQILLSDGGGIYIPQMFATNLVFGAQPNQWQGVSAENLDILERGPEGEEYWEAWEEVLDQAFLVSGEGRKYTLGHDGDVWAIPDGMEWSDEEEWYVWPEEEEV